MNEPDSAPNDPSESTDSASVSAYQPPMAAYPAASLPTAPAPVREGMGAGWKVFIVVLVLVTISSLAGCCGLVSLLGFGQDPTTAFGDSIAVIHVDGVIAGTGSSLDGVISPEEMLSYLDQAADDDSVRAVVLRIDSPGGTVAASQEISMEVARLAEIKPVIASVGDVGASGAYMIASQCDEIWALPTSAVGSIGVITEIPNVAGLLDKLGIEFTVLTAGEYKDAGSPYRSLTATETDLIQQGVDTAYEEFIGIVADGRELPEDDVRDMATGWAWSAREAQGMGLVDELGTYNDALDRAADLGEIEGDYDVVVYDSYQYGDLLNLLLGVRNDIQQLKSLNPDVGPAAPAIPR